MKGSLMKDPYKTNGTKILLTMNCSTLPHNKIITIKISKRKCGLTQGLQHHTCIMFPYI